MRVHQVAFGCVAVLTSLAIVAPASASSPRLAENPAAPVSTRAAIKPELVYPHLNLPHGAWAQVYSDGIAEIHTRSGQTQVRHVPLLNPDGGTGPVGAAELPGKGALIADLAQSAPQPYAAHEVVVIYQPSTAAPMGLLTSLGASSARPLFTGTNRGRLRQMRTAAERKTGRTLLDFPDAVLLHIAGASVPEAVARLRANPSVAFAEPDWTVTTTNTPPVPVPASIKTPRARNAAAIAPGVPSNYALTSSEQALLNTPGVNAVPAYADLAQRYGQLPGQGEIITNVSLGTLDDASAAANHSDPCNFYASNYGPTTVVMNGQRYLDLPSMPLIPTYTASSDGLLNPTGETCGDDPQLTEVGLDFSMMAPLPDQLQRPGETGSGLTDLLGIAPGASYRLVVPSTPGGAISDVDAAFLGAAIQWPTPNVITASLGFGLDQVGFPSRYLEDDPMTSAIIATIVSFGIVVCAAAGDGLRTFTNAAVPPGGGAVATNVTPDWDRATSLSDVEYSDAPSLDLDSGAIDVGGTTLDDIFAAPPDNPANAAQSYMHAYPATRYDGGRLYASGFGSRVNISAPGDNVVSFQHPIGGGADAVQVVSEGGTSAAAPEVAAAAAIVLQVARLTGDHRLQRQPLAVRRFLEDTATPVPAVPQSDTPINVSPQVNVGRAVETLLARAGAPAQPGAARVAVQQRRQHSALAGSIDTWTDPANIGLTGRLSYAWITIAPDWTGLGAGPVDYLLTGPQGGQLATTPWARLRPATILASAGLPLTSTSPRSVPLTYQAIRDGQVIASTTFTLTFGPCDGTVQSVQAPVAPSVVTGPSIPVSYDLTGLVGATNPTLVVSQPGRVDPATGLFFRPSYTVPLTAQAGTVDVPVSALQGAGIYGIGIQDAPGGWFARNDSTYTFLRVAPSVDARPDPPLLSARGTPPGHFLNIRYHGTFHLHYDVTAVAGATGAVAEFSAPGPTPFNNMNTFNNPNGSQRDANGHDSGSVAWIPLNGTSGNVFLDSGALGLDATMYYTVRVLATSGGQVIGAASGVSTIQMNGVAPADGGSVTGGFGVNPGGSDGLLTSSAGSVEAFDQSTGATSKVVSSARDGYSTVGYSSAGIYANDVGVYDDYNPATKTDTFDVLNPVATQTQAGTWNPPDALGGLLVTADNTATSQDAVLSYKSGLLVTTTDVGAGTFGAPVSLAPALTSVGAPISGGFAENTATGQAVTGVADGTNPSGPATLVTTDLASGQLGSFTGPASGFLFGLAVNPVTNTAAEGSFGGLGIVNLATRAGSLAQPGGEVYQFPAAIGRTGDFLVEEVASPDYFGQTPNNNAMSSIILTDSSGNVLRRYEQFNFYNTFLPDLGDFLQVNPTTNTAFTLGPGGSQIYPFGY